MFAIVEDANRQKAKVKRLQISKSHEKIARSQAAYPLSRYLTWCFLATYLMSYKGDKKSLVSVLFATPFFMPCLYFSQT